jgi:hypothetical protein
MGRGKRKDKKEAVIGIIKMGFAKKRLCHRHSLEVWVIEGVEREKKQNQ